MSSLEEGDGIINGNEYKHAVYRIQKINQKISTLMKNWNEESKSAKTPNELVEIDTFYRTYMDQYNGSRRTLERLMEICVEYDKDVTSLYVLQSELSSEQSMPLPTPRTKKTIHDQFTKEMPATSREPGVREDEPEETSPKQTQTEEEHPPMPGPPRIIQTTVIGSIALPTTQPI